MADAPPAAARRPSTWQSLAHSFASWRTASVTLQQFPSGLPLGLILVALPAWLKLEGYDNTTIGWLTAAQAPYAFKFLWSPLMDRYAPPLLGRKRGWALLAQAALLVATLGLAIAALHPRDIVPIAVAAVAIAFFAASQDIAIDAYAVEVLRPEEMGAAAGARGAVSRFAMTLSGRIAITLSQWVAWPMLFGLQSIIFLPAGILTIFSPEPEAPAAPPRTLRQAVWEPFVGFLRQHRSVEIAAFLVLYKFGDNLATALVSPFLLEVGYSKWDVGFIFFWIGFAGSVIGTVAGGAITTGIGLGRALWLFGFVQAIAHVGYMLIVQIGVNRPVMYGAMLLETAAMGLGTGAFSVLLLRLTQKRFSATQYALLSSIFAVGRTAAGPLAGVLIDALGWMNFFIVTMIAAIPGLVMLQRFVPFGTREPTFQDEPPRVGRPIGLRALAARAAAGAFVGLIVAAIYTATLEAFRAMRTTPGTGFSLEGPFERIFTPSSFSDWFTLAAVVVFALTCGLATAALAVARRGLARD